jgi:hypothetical protein
MIHGAYVIMTVLRPSHEAIFTLFRAQNFHFLLRRARYQTLSPISPLTHTLCSDLFCTKEQWPSVTVELVYRFIAGYMFRLL